MAPPAPLTPSRNRRWLWIGLFVWVLLLLFALGTGWNLVLVRNYRRMQELARELSLPSEARALSLSILLGTLGFVATLGTMIVFFVRLLREMRLNQVQAEFLAAVSHELKTPIAAIELSSSLLRAGEITEEQRASLWTSHQRELKRLRTEVETLLEAVRWQSRPDWLKTQPQRLEDWIASSLPRWRAILDPQSPHTAGDSILHREGEPLDSHARVDLRSLNLILDNLFDNARKFAIERPQVTIRTTRIPPSFRNRRGGWSIEVQDRGWGFDPSDSKKIFGRFFRARTQAPYAIPGTGLGLYLADTASRALKLKLSGTSPGRGYGALFKLEGVWDSKTGRPEKGAP